MNPKAEAVLLDFPNTPWAKATSKRHDAELANLAAFTDHDVVNALKSLRRATTRGHITTDEIIAEIRRLRRRAEISQQQVREQVDEREVEADRADILRMLVLATREEIAKGVTYARQVGALSPDPMPADITEWTDYARGIVWAAMEHEGVFS